jgi:HSP20 family protein
MSALTTFEPFASMRQFEDAVSRLLTEPQSSRPWSPSVDIYETDDNLVLRVDLPGVEQKEIDVRVENQTLTIAGERKFENVDSSKGYHRIERSYGSFNRSFALPSAFDTEKIGAEYKNGVLTVTLPKKEAAKPRQIKVAVQ